MAGTKSKLHASTRHRLSIATRNEPGDASHGSSRAVRTPPEIQIPYAASQAGKVDKPESGPGCGGRSRPSGGQQSGSRRNAGRIGRHSARRRSRGRIRQASAGWPKLLR